MSSKRMGTCMAAVALLLLMGVSAPLAYGQSAAGGAVNNGVWAAHGNEARLMYVSRRSRHRRRRRKARARGRSVAVSRERMELAQEMTRQVYELGQGLPPAQRGALLIRLLYTLPPDVMAAEKQRWAVELFGLARDLPVADEDSTPAGGPQDAQAAAPPSKPGEGPAVQPSFRNEAIATAAVRLATYDCEHALELLDTLPGEQGRREDARTMAARLVFDTYLQSHGPAGVPVLLAHARKWGEDGGFPYAASALALDSLSAEPSAAEDFFRQAFAVFARGDEGAFGVGEFGELLARAAATEAIPPVLAEEAGRAIVAQAESLAGGGTAAHAGAAPPLSEAGRQRLAAALGDVRLAAPLAYAQASKDWPGMAKLRTADLVSPAEPKVDAGLEASFADLAEAMRERRGPEALRELIARGLEEVNERYNAGACAGCEVPDPQSWALVSLSAYAEPMTIGEQLKTIEAPFWHAYFLAIAAEQVGEPARVADPAAHHVLENDESQPE